MKDGISSKTYLEPLFRPVEPSSYSMFSQYFQPQISPD